MKKYLFVQHLNVINANAASTPYIIGFPAMTAWLGLVHVLEQRLHPDERFGEFRFPSVAVCCHTCDLQVFRDKKNFYATVIGTRNPLRKKGKDFVPAPFIESPRCHLDVSLLIEIDGFDEICDKEFENAVRLVLPCLKAAGGDIISFKNIRVCSIEENDGVSVQKLKNRLMPGHVLVERSDLMEAGQENDSDAMERMLDVLQGVLPSDGWIVPIAVGFQDLSGKLEVRNQRDYDHEHHFVEPLVTLGEFTIPYRVPLERMLWSYSYDEAERMYLCRNEKANENLEVLQ